MKLEVEKEDRVEVEVEEGYRMKVEESMEVLWGRRREKEKGKFDVLPCFWVAIRRYRVEKKNSLLNYVSVNLVCSIVFVNEVCLINLLAICF